MTNKQKLVNWNRSKAALAADLEHIAHMKRTEYHNTAVAASNAEIHALNGKIEYLIDVMSGMAQGLADAHKEINALKTQLLKVRGGHAPLVEHTITTTTVEVTLFYGDKDLQKQYRKGTNINWNSDIPAVDIAFNEFDLYRSENKRTSMLTPDEVRSNWSTLGVQCRKLTGMPLSRLLKVYADDRKLNY